jgi:N-acetylglucosaminyldiphosphoundecaprenol N-acetyl-beta-D-mannosaminyltransferase
MSIIKITINETEMYSGEFKEFSDYIFDLNDNSSSKKLIVTHINLRNYYFLNKDKLFKDKIKENCLCVFDGIGMKLGIFLKKLVWLPDLNGTDLFPILMQRLSGRGKGVYFLGTKKDILKDAAENIKRAYPTLKLSGYQEGFFTEGEKERITKEINSSGADVLFVGMGFPIQEKFVIKNKDELKVSMIWNVGGLFDFYSNRKKRAPVWIRKIRLEWLFRLVLEPSRMIHRNTIAAIWSFSNIIFSKCSLQK